jgi:hypothetical protein
MQTTTINPAGQDGKISGSVDGSEDVQMIDTDYQQSSTLADAAMPFTPPDKFIVSPRRGGDLPWTPGAILAEIKAVSQTAQMRMDKEEFGTGDGIVALVLVHLLATAMERFVANSIAASVRDRAEVPQVTVTD